jgi:hypothetical protein
MREGSLLYVSRRVATDKDVREIVAVSRTRNAQLHVTGALVASRSRFVQILEGPRTGVDTLMESIRRDPRHADVDVLLYDDIRERRFPGWSLAYSGPSTFIEGLIKAVADRTASRPEPHHLRRLITAMQALAKDLR